MISNNRMTQPALWRLGISGDIPIVLLRITQPDQVKIVNELLAAHHYLRVRGMIFDLVILNEYPGGYLQNLQEELEYQMRSSFSGYLIDKNGGVFLRNLSQVSQQEVDLLKTVAKVMLSGSRGALSAQLKPDEFTNLKHSISEFNHQGKSRGLIKKEIKDCEFYNGVGGFVSNGDSYRIFIENNNFPPMPWSNVIANPDFGTLVTESGGGYTWSENSRENRMTAWNNDPIIDPPSEVLYIREIDSSKFWSLTPRPVISDALFIVEHSRAYSSFHTEIESVESKLTIEISGEKKIKFWNIELKNHSSKSKNLELFLYLEWVLGVSRHDSNRYTCCNYDAKSKLLYAYNYYNSDFSGRIVGIGSDHKIKGFTTERVDFLGRNGSSARPYVFMSQDAISGVPISLNKKLSVGNDSCGVLRVNIKLQPGEKQNIRFYLLEAATLEELGNLAADMEDDSRDSVKEKSLRQYYDNVHKSIQVKTPDKSFDILINSWLLYQTLACRIYARTGFYQSGGAYGFRDQLQDVLALVYSKPDLARRQIILHASRQFPEGDVQHWWHPPSGKGVRTKISDDYLWLPYVTAKYLEQTGDFSILNEQTGFVSGPLLAEYEHEIYIVPQKSDQISDIYTHCKLAIERGMKFGSHGLPLMGAGDWNDGMNEVGFEGKGESVWLAWFYIEVLNLFSFVAENRNESEISNKYRNLAKQLSLAVDKHAWDGKWYRRAYFDDGTPLGSHINDECQIDSISQSWGIISGAADPAKAKIAMENVMKILVRDQDKIICLLHPAFNNGSLEPGYIKGYLPGIRENGGQYTHAAAWTVIATAMTGKGTEAANLFSMINPINYTKDINGVNKFKGEPYVLCGDVYAVEPHVGRAGWSWYTGSAGWMYKAGIEYILGLKIYSDYFTLKPCIPASWSEYGIELNMRDARYSIKIENPDNLESGLAQIWVDGENIIDGKVKWEKYSGRLQVDVKAVLKPS